METQSLDELRERAMELMMTRPAEVTPEAEWLVAELERHKELMLGIIDHLITESESSSSA